MAGNRLSALRAVSRELDLQSLELEELRARQMRAVLTKTATGSGDIANLFKLDRKFRVVFVRCHFVGTASTAEFALSVDSASGSAFDTKLFSIAQAGGGQDVHLRTDDGGTSEPSPWTFQSGDQIRIDWTNPASGNITWGLEIGFVLAS